MDLRTEIERRWYGRPGWLWCLWPLEWLFRCVAWWRRRFHARRASPFSVPVVIVGNITVGGTGKSPLVAVLVEHLRSRGLRVGIVSRGYGGKGPFPAEAGSGDTRTCGDEPVMLARLTGVPVVVHPDRVAAVSALLLRHDVDVVISDDGLQHYRLWRDLELMVMDAPRGIGNGHCLPVGPLREPRSRLRAVDFVISNGGTCADSPGAQVMMLQPGELIQVATGATATLASWRGKRVHAVAGIGHPKRFFDTLRQAGIEVIEHPFPDHHHYVPADLPGADGLPVLMTEKDAVKCAGWADERVWMLRVQAVLPDAFWAGFDRALSERLTQRGKHG